MLLTVLKYRGGIFVCQGIFPSKNQRRRSTATDGVTYEKERQGRPLGTGNTQLTGTLVTYVTCRGTPSCIHCIKCRCVHQVSYRSYQRPLLPLLTVAMVLLIGMLCVSGAHAWNEAQLQLLKTTNSCPNCDLSGADLSYANLNNANLSGADLSGADLSGAILSGATWTDGSLCRKASYGECYKGQP